MSNRAFVAVINASTRDRFFGGPPAVGRTIEADGQHFRVIGVVPDLPILRQISFAEIYVPLTTAKTDAYREQLLAGFTGLLLARSPADFPAIKAEFASRLPQVPLPNKRWEKLTSQASTLFEYAAEMLIPGEASESKPALMWAVIAGMMLLFALLPAVNLVNLNMSRIMERASEIGVRKAFGASSRTLVGQFIVENVVLALVGGALGFAGSVLVLEAVNRSGLVLRAVRHELPHLPLRSGPRGVLWRPLRRLSGLAHVAAASGAGPQRSLAMIRHLLRIVWNRRRANALVALEILLSFLVLCAVATMFVYYVDNYRRPLGYVWQDTWVVTMDANARDLPGADAGTAAAGTGPRALQRAMVARLITIAGDLPEVASASAAFIGPYDNSTWRNNIKVGGKQYGYYYNEATDGFAGTLRMNVLRGRWFDRSDDGADWTAAVINLRLAREMFGDGDPVGKLVEDESEPDPASPIQHERTRLRIVGVIDDFRKDGEYGSRQLPDRQEPARRSARADLRPACSWCASGRAPPPRSRRSWCPGSARPRRTGPSSRSRWN